LFYTNSQSRRFAHLPSMPMTTALDITRLLEQWFPLTLAADWDNVGLLIGDGAQPVRRVMTCLTVTPASAAEAVREKVDLIVSHHPVLFRPTKTLTAATEEGAMLLSLIRAGVAVYSPHTAFDNAPGGINDFLAKRLGLTGVRPLRSLAADKNVKLAIFVPENDLAKVSDALFAAGAGVIGQYRECSFRLAGTGTFFGGDLSNPTVGQKGRREDVSEWRLEVICPHAKLEGALRAMRAAHSYEEPAFDIYPLQGDPSRYGQGRVGDLAEPTTLGALANSARKQLGAAALQTVGDLAKPIRRVALACGAAGEFLRDALRAGADAFLTGELRFHDALAAEDAGVAVVIAGHYATERPAVEDLAVRLATAIADITAWPSRDERDPIANPVSGKP
jgi:dinuclear metal center YbgI/SA1388 family protein